MKEVLDRINLDRLTTLARNLVRIPSINPPGHTDECVNLLMDSFRQYGVRGRIVSKFEGKPNFVAQIGKGSPTLLWNSHMDVVTPGVEKWEHEPFGGIIKDGILYGRGSVDAKGSIAAMAEAFLTLAEYEHKLIGTLKFTAAPDEEDNGDAGTQVLADAGELKADFAVYGAPTNLRVDIAERGVIWFHVISHGKTSHGARPHLGVNAVETIVEVAKALKDRLPPRLKTRSHPLVSPPCMSLNLIQGGEMRNVIPDYCKIVGDRRMIPGEKQDAVIRELKEIVDEFRTAENRLEFEVEKFIPASEVPPDHPLVRALLKNSEQVTGEKKTIGGKDGCTDAYIINGKLGIPTAVFGPGDFTLCHRINEHISLEQLTQATKVYTLTALDMLS